MHTPTQTPTVTPAHTPGPWKVVADPQHAGKHAFHDNRWIMTADAEIEFGHDPSSWYISQGTIICQMRDHISAPEANARLIAASPDLLAALKNCTEHLRLTISEHMRVLSIYGHVPKNHPLDMPVLEQARAAIARATGKGGAE